MSIFFGNVYITNFCYIKTLSNLIWFYSYPFSTVSKYNLSTFFLAQGVRRKNVRLDLIDGSTTKQLIRILSPSSGNPYFSTKNTRIASSVFPCNGLLEFCSIMVYSRATYLPVHE